MPSRRDPADLDVSLCKRCQSNEPTVTVRNERLCTECFRKYVSTKIIKRMESFRVRHATLDQERKLLLPLSFGPGSLVLLHVLSEHLKGQAEKTGRTGFSLHVVHVHDDAASQDDIDHARLIEKVKQRFPDHSYSDSCLSNLFDSDGGDSLTALTREMSSDISSGAEKLNKFLASLDSATARADTKQILLRRLIVKFAKTHNGEAILWGDSTTRLAERTLAETAKGRGFSLPWIVADGDSPHGIPSYFPMRDLLSKEIAAFAPTVGPTLDDLIIGENVKPVVSTKNTTIDDLMKQYFESVERDYPSIVANVVKTSSKLQGTPLSQVETQCELCDMPLDGQAPERSRLCYGNSYQVPKGLLVNASPWFAKAPDGRFKEGEGMAFKFDDTSKTIIEHFVHYLSARDIMFEDIPKPDPPSEERNLPQHDQLPVRLWIFGDKYFGPELQSLTLAHLVEFMKHWHVHPDALLEALEASTSESPLASTHG